MVYLALLPLMRTARLPAFDWTDPPTHQFKWTRPFRWKTKSGFCACAITFQTCTTFVMSVRLSFRIELLGSQWMDFHEIWYLSILKNISRKFKFHSNLTRITGTLHGDHCTFLIICRSVRLRMWNVSGKSCGENQDTHFTFKIFFLKSCLFWSNVAICGTATQGTEESITRRMSFACWITKATDTHSECVMLVAFPLQQWVHEHASMLRLYVHCLSFCYYLGRSHIQRSLSLGTPFIDARLEYNSVLRDTPLFSKLLILIPESN